MVRADVTFVTERLACSQLEMAGYTALPRIMSEIEDIRFHHTEIHAGTRLLVKSTCMNCGMSVLLSAADGSLKKWERWHECDVILPVN